MNNLVRLPSGLWVLEDLLPKRRPLCVDLFCGCGGFSLGMISAGFEVIGACDWDVPATFSYLYNLGAYPLSMHFIEPSDKERFADFLTHNWEKKGVKDFPVSGANRPIDRPGVSHYWLGDIRKLKGADMLSAMGLEKGDLDCVVGGPPCQGFSKAGKREVMDPRNSLVFEWVRLVCELQPKTIAMENVPGMLSMVTPEGVPVLDAVARALQDGGFGTYDALLKSFTTTAGIGGALRSTAKAEKKKTKNKARPAPKAQSAPPASTQGSLFGKAGE